ncbi:hypothetical protein MGYG_00803 [Nannizzia gypsea CBS 118893]|uniref:Uncharacterized protein n=1 Tax=Arthroderma gypseum (strain ATCC MYA-4604 / CBS 118893) TaxID=535722 RepID=E5R1Y3_ARTGP|nr:hypothetical protein MGYG_00803 [Nannizzia gypsea CBS 118893]EFQ97762.1 hypothetical protein MGYG_00803 [Nannizzia gypsea CBS 118893]
MQSLAIKRSREEDKAGDASEDELTLRRKRVRPLCLRPVPQSTESHGFTALPLTPTTTEDRWNDNDTTERLEGQPIHISTDLSSGSNRQIEADTDMNMMDCVSPEHSMEPVWPTTCHSTEHMGCNFSSSLGSTETSIEVSQTCNMASSTNSSMGPASIGNLHTPAPTITNPAASRFPSPISEYQAETKSHTGKFTLNPFQSDAHLDDTSIRSNLSLYSSVSLEPSNKANDLQATCSALHLSTNPEADTFEKCSDSATNGNMNLMTKSPRKATIAMGFRADCDKCQRREPGHYSHIVYS